MADYSFVPTDALRNMVAHSRRENAEWVQVRRDLESRLKSARKMAAHWAQETADQKAELRSREPECVGTYVHSDGFRYESWLGREHYEYRILGTPVVVRSLGTQDGYDQLVIECPDHNNDSFPWTVLESALAVGYRHFREMH